MVSKNYLFWVFFPLCTHSAICFLLEGGCGPQEQAAPQGTPGQMYWVSSQPPPPPDHWVQFLHFCFFSFVSSLPIHSYDCEYMHIDIYLHKWRWNKLSPQGRLPTTLSLTLIVFLAVWSKATRLPAVRIDVKHRAKLRSQG